METSNRDINREDIPVSISALLHDSKIRLSNIVLVSTTTSSKYGNTLFRSRFKINNAVHDKR